MVKNAVITIRVTEELKGRINQLTDQQNVNISEKVRLFLYEYLGEQKRGLEPENSMKPNK